MARYARCPGVFELDIKCGKKFGTLSDTEFDHIMRNEVKPDNSPENCRPLCPECHQAKTSKKDSLEAAKGRAIRRETKEAKTKAARKGKHFKTGAKLQSRGFPSKEERKAMKEKYERAR